MKPEISKLLLDNYFVSAISVNANNAFDVNRSMDLTVNDLIIDSHAVMIADDVRHWQVVLNVSFNQTTKINSPYSFSVEVVGFFSIVENYPEDLAEWLVKTNASSVLFSVARETLRSSMASGPWKPIILPTVSFYTQETKDFLKNRPHVK